MKTDNNGLICLENSVASLKISLFGGNVVSYRPKSQKHDVFWLGDKNKFDNIQAIRGGIPVCWPRFAEEKLNGNLPRHGFARLSMWNLESVAEDDEKIEVKLSLLPDEKYGVGVSAELLVKITDKLECCLETTNNGEEEFDFSEALHAYFNVGDRDKIKIKGLDGYQYKSSIDGKIYDFEGNLEVKGEFDGAFINHTNIVEIEDEIYGRVITMEKHGSKSTIVWNPNKDLAEMSDGQYKKFVCVEPANQGDLFVKLPAGEKHKISMVISVKDWG
jgi:D-hexose-6-phosphate mutarotase